MMTSQKLHAKIFLQHGRENVFCITICVIHHTAHFSAFFLTHATHAEDFVASKTHSTHANWKIQEFA